MRRHNSKTPVNKYMNSCSHKQTRFKHKAGDCGKSQCGVCHYYKYPKRIRTRQELMSLLPS